MHRTPRRRQTLIFPAIASLSLLPTPTPANTWINPAGGSWSNAANWSPAQVPTIATDAIFNLAAGTPDFAAYPGYTVTLPDSGTTAQRIQVRNDRLALALPAGGSANIPIYVATTAGETAALTLTGGAFTATFAEVGNPGNGSLAVTGGATLDVTFNGLSAGNIASSAAAIVTVDGPSSRITGGFTFAAAGNASLAISNGAAAIGGGTFGANGGTAHVSATGAGSTLGLSTATLTFGDGAGSSASLDLTSGAQAAATTFHLARNGATGSLTLDGTNTSLTYSTALTLGDLGGTTFTGSLSNGAKITPAPIAPNPTIDLGAGSGTASLSLATGSSIKATNLRIGLGLNSQATVTIASGSSVTSSITTLGNGGPSAPSVTIGSTTATPSTWTNTGPFFFINGGSLNVNSGGQIISKSINLSTPGTLALNGGSVSLTNNLTFDGGTITGFGALHATNILVQSGSPLISPDGTLALDADLTLASGSPTLAFDLTSPSSYDRLTSVHTLTFGGTLAVSLAPTYTPAVGDTFDLLDFSAPAPNTSFATLSLPSLPLTMTWDTSALYTTGTLSVALPEPSHLLAATGLALLPLTTRTRRRSNP